MIWTWHEVVEFTLILLVYHHSHPHKCETDMIPILYFCRLKMKETESVIKFVMSLSGTTQHNNAGMLRMKVDGAVLKCFLRQNIHSLSKMFLRQQ